MRGQDTILRQIQTKPAIDGQLITFEMPRDLDYATIEVNIDGVITLPADATGVHSLAPLQLLQNVFLQANGSKNLCNAPGYSIWLKNAQTNKGLAPILQAPQGHVAGDYTVRGTIYIDQDMIDGINPKDSQLPSTNLSSLNLQVQIGSSADVFIGAGAATFAGNVTVNAVQVREYKDSNGNRYTPACVQYYNNLSLPLPSSQSDLQQILTTNILQRMLVLYTTINGEGAQGVLNSVRLERNGSTLANITGAALQRQMQRCWPEGVPDGLYILDPAKAWGQNLAKLTDGIDMRPAKGVVADQLYLYLDVNGGAGYKIDIAQNTFQNYADFIGI